MEEIKEIEKRLDEVDFLLTHDFASEIIKIRQEANRLLKENTTLEQRLSKDFIEQVISLSNREKEQLVFFEKSKNTINLIHRKVKLTHELGALKMEEYYIKNQ